MTSPNEVEPLESRINRQIKLLDGWIRDAARPGYDDESERADAAALQAWHEILVTFNQCVDVNLEIPGP